VDIKECYEKYERLLKEVAVALQYDMNAEECIAFGDGAVVMHKFTPRHTELALIEDEYWLDEILPGSWLVKTDGRLKIMTDMDFRCSYKKVPIGESSNES